MRHRASNKRDRFAKLLVRSRWHLLIVAIALGVAGFILKKGVRFDNSIEGMYAADNQQLLDYQELKDRFGGSEIVLAVYEDPDLFATDGSGLQKLEDRVDELRDVSGVIDVLSLSEINQALQQVYGFSQSVRPVLDHTDKMAASFVDAFEGFTHASDRKTAAIVCLLEDLDTLHIPRSKTIAELRHITNGWENSKVTGEPVLLTDGFRFIRRDGDRLNQICLLLMGVVIILCFRSFRWVIIPILVLQLSLWMTLALLAILGWKLTMVSSMLSAIVAVISVATIVHITVRYREMRQGHSRIRSMELVMGSLILPITWTCLTTTAGFFALTLADVKPISDFGWMMAFGSLMVLMSVLMLVPSLALLGNLDTDPQDTWGEGWLERVLRSSSKAIAHHPKKIGIGIAALMVLIGAGMFRLEVETDFTKNFRQDSEIIQAYTFVEERMGGAGLLDVVIKTDKVLNQPFLDRVIMMQRELSDIRLRGQDQPALTHVISFADAHRIMSTRPVLDLVPAELQFQAMAKVMPGFAGQLKSSEPDENGDHYFHIMLRTSQQKTAKEQAELIAKINIVVDAFFNQPVGTSNGQSAKSSNAKTTGFFVLLSNLVNSVLADQLKTFIAACVFIGLVVLLAFGSPKIVILALIPNVLPIVGLMGILGWLGIKLNMGAAMIAAVSMGLSIDGTIHYLTGYRHNRVAGLRASKAIDRVQFRTGRALIYSTFALMIGFGSLCTSEFIPTVFFGGLVGLSMLGGMLGNLIVLPVLLILFDSKPYKRSKRRSRKDKRNNHDSPGFGSPKSEMPTNDSSDPPLKKPSQTPAQPTSSYQTTETGMQRTDTVPGSPTKKVVAENESTSTQTGQSKKSSQTRSQNSQSGKSKNKKKKKRRSRNR